MYYVITLTSLYKRYLSIIIIRNCMLLLYFNCCLNIIVKMSYDPTKSTLMGCETVLNHEITKIQILNI